MGQFTQNQVTRNYDRRLIQIGADGTMFVLVIVSNALGREVDRFEVRIPPSGPIVDADGNQLAASVPAGLNNARTSFLTAIDNAIDNAAAAGKFSR